MNYTLVLYKSDGCNTCRGCVMEQWGSDFSLDMNVAEIDAVERIATTFAAPSEGGSYEAYLINVRNGQQVCHHFEQYGGSSWRQEPGGVSTRSTDEYWETIDEDEGKRLDGLIRVRVSEILEQRRLESERAEAEKKEMEVKQKEAKERQQLEALKQKYEGTK